MDADTSRHFGDRSARIEDDANGLILVLLGEASACRHAIPPLAISGSLRPSVYKIGNGPNALDTHMSTAGRSACPELGYAPHRVCASAGPPHKLREVVVAMIPYRLVVQLRELMAPGQATVDAEPAIGVLGLPSCNLNVDRRGLNLKRGLKRRH